MLVSCLHQTFWSCVFLNWFESLSIIQFKCVFFFSFRHNAHSSEKLLPLSQKGCAGLGDERPGFHSYRTGKGLSNSLVTLQLRFSSGTSVILVSQRLSPRSKGQIANIVHDRDRLGDVCVLQSVKICREKQALGTLGEGGLQMGWQKHTPR